MKVLLVLALSAHAAAADPRPPDRTAGLDGSPVIANVMIPPIVDATMTMTPPVIDQAILLGPSRNLLSQLGKVAGVFLDGFDWLVTATIPRAI